MRGEKSTLYDHLGLVRSATQSDIVRTYRKLSSEMMREASAPNPRRAALIHEAYEVLSDPQRRAAYDQSLRGARFLGAAGGDKPWRARGLAVAGLALALGALGYFTLGNNPDVRRQGPGLSAQEVQTAASVSVGRVNRVEMSGARAALGAAVAVEEGVMLAPCQGLAPGAQILVRIPPRDVPAQLKQSDDALGLCKLAVSGAGSWPLPMASVAPNVGDKVYAANLNALGEVVISPGVVKKVVRGPNGSVIESTARSGPPLEGSPLLDAQGRLLAVTMQGQHTMLPAAWVVNAPARKRPPPEKPAERDASSAPPSDAADASAEKLKKVPPEKREALEKAFRPPKDL